MIMIHRLSSSHILHISPRPVEHVVVKMNSSMPTEKLESETEKSKDYQHEGIFDGTKTEVERVGEIATDAPLTMESFAHLDERRILAKVTSNLGPLLIST